MKAVILAGGLGTRLSEETSIRPKPMVEIGGKPILWQFMNIYIAHGINEFFIVAGYKAEVINEYFLNLAMLCGMSPREPRSRWRSDADTQFSI